MRLMSTKWAGRAVVAALVLTASAIPGRASIAQATSQVDRDAAELKSYRLTMPKIRQLAQAGEAMAKAMQADPRFQAQQALDREIKALEDKDELTEAEEKRLEQLRARKEEEEAKDDARDSDRSTQTLDDMVKAIEREPAMAGAIRSAGLTPREYSLLSLSLFQAMMAHGLRQSLGAKELPKDVTDRMLLENLKFVADNEAELAQVLERMKALEKKP
jgi:hypothetical protein